MSEIAANAFARKMRICSALLWIGMAVSTLGAALIFVLRPLSDNFDLITTVIIGGVALVGVSSAIRLLGNCPKCGNRFCGSEESGSYSAFASKCRSCGYKAGESI